MNDLNVKYKDIQFLPVKIIVSFLLFTFALYFLSYWCWVPDNASLLIIYNFSIYLMLFLGFAYGFKTCILKKVLLKKNILSSKLWKILMVFSIINLYATLLVIFQTDKLSIDLIIKYILIANTSLADVYLMRNESQFIDSSASSNIFMFLYVYFGFAFYFFKIVSLVLWNDLSRINKLSVVVIVSVEILAYVLIGTNKILFDYLIITPFVLVLRYYFRGNKIEFSFKFIRSNFVFILIIAGAVSFFILTYNSRMIHHTIDVNPLTGAIIDTNNQNFIERFFSVFKGLDFYLSHSYYFLDKSFDLPFIPCYGFGSSPFLTNILSRFIQLQDVAPFTYEARFAAMLNYSNGQFWNTAYVSFANDVTLLGVPFFVFLLSFLCGNIWRDIIINKNILALPIFFIMLILFFYLSSNNQILGKSQFFIFFPLLILWLFFKIRA